MTIRQYISTFLLGLSDYLKDCRRDLLLNDLREIDPDVIRRGGYDYPWKEGNLRHYVRQRRLALKGWQKFKSNTDATPTVIRSPYVPISYPTKNILCNVQLNTGETALLRWNNKQKAWRNLKGQPECSVTPTQVVGWTAFVGKAKK